MKSLILATLLLGAAAHADFKLSRKAGEVNCSADDNQSWVLNEDRTSVQYTVEGESLGAQEIVDIKTDRKSFISYRTNEGTLTLGKKDTWQFAEEDEPSEVVCE